MSNSFGKLFRITAFGESHGKAIGVVIDGCPAGLEISQEEIQEELDKRRPGLNDLSTKRKEKDEVEILSGIFEGRTLGTPICLVIHNQDARSEDYEAIKDIYRPGHADYVYDAKYGVRDYRGGGRASARETTARVAAGAVAKKILKLSGISIVGYVIQIGNIKVDSIDEKLGTSDSLRCPDSNARNKFEQEIKSAQKDEDSIGGIIEVVARGVPAGLGEPVFDKLSADLAKAMMSIPAVKGFEIGDGFACASRRGSENNDELENLDGRIRTKTNHAGGIVGGISNGEDIVARLALKPASSIGKEQETVDNEGNKKTIKIAGRHDPCVCPRAVPVAEAMMALVLADHYLLIRSNRL